ncbi:Rab5-bind domain-containing protein [Meloidogyne graminicola]|uniref:Rab5-bind domain-containing protein n=1 Tax=Meloidogyne graminicola TaxID=189291 RepID=A0A8T0A1B4_9BILA|nr:Rab5-bind domain-containing protein [Meloidogyne graminicola]
MSDHPSSSKNSNMQWMYEGTKSIVNREDYLLGKKIDRNFELFSDVVIKDKEEENQENFFKQKFLHNDPKTQKISALDVRTVRNEDPLVALKFQEEQRRRQMLENPLLKLKAQKILQKEFKKKMKKEEKKLKKKEKKMKELHTKNNKS